MRSIFIQKLHMAMREDKRLFLLIGDTGFNLVEPLFEEFPDRTLNVGVAEQNLIGIAAGLCNVGFRPVCYAISNFLIFRPLEQIRNDICLHNYPVILAGTSAGFDNGGLWATHYVTDDIGCLKPLPNMQIYSPSSVESMDAVLVEALVNAGPSYIRIAKSNFTEGKPVELLTRLVLQDASSSVLVVAHGKMIKNALEAAALAPAFSVLAVDKIKPLDVTKLKAFMEGYEKLVVIEDNFKSGLYNSIAQFMVENNLRRPELYFIGPEEEYEKHIGDVTCLEEKYGLTPQKISDFIKTL